MRICKPRRACGAAAIALVVGVGVCAAGSGAAGSGAAKPASPCCTADEGCPFLADQEWKEAGPVRIATAGSLWLPGQDRYLPSEDPRNGGAGARVRLIAQAPEIPVAGPQVPEVELERRPIEPERAQIEPVRTQPEPMAMATATPAETVLDAAPPIPPARSTGDWRVQAFASGSRTRAESIAAQIEKRLRRTAEVERAGNLWKVRCVGLSNREEAETVRRALVEIGYGEAFLLPGNGR